MKCYNLVQSIILFYTKPSFLMHVIYVYLEINIAINYVQCFSMVVSIVYSTLLKSSKYRYDYTSKAKTSHPVTTIYYYYYSLTHSTRGLNVYCIPIPLHLPYCCKCSLYASVWLCCCCCKAFRSVRVYRIRVLMLQHGSQASRKATAASVKT